MSETEMARRRRDAARRAMGPQQQEVQDRLADILAITGGVFAGGASYTQLLELIEDYAERTGQKPQKLLRDTEQLKALLEPDIKRYPIWQENLIREYLLEYDYVRALPPQDRERLFDGFRRSALNTLQGKDTSLSRPQREMALKNASKPLWEVREFTSEFLSDPVETRDRIASQIADRRVQMAQSRPRIDAIVDYSRHEDNPRLLQYSRDLEYDPSRGRYDNSKDAWRKSVDPEFLDKLTFIHWTSNPESLVKGKGLPSTTGETGALSAGMYFRDDPSGHGFITTRYVEAL